jgi:hypothetical protein
MQKMTKKIMFLYLMLEYYATELLACLAFETLLELVALALFTKFLQRVSGSLLLHMHFI